MKYKYVHICEVHTFYQGEKHIIDVRHIRAYEYTRSIMHVCNKAVIY